MLKLEKKPEEDMTVFEAGTHPAIVTYPDELLDVASEKMMTNKIGRLSVVDKKNPKKILGYIDRGSILEARSKYVEEEQKREAGWFKGSASVTG